MTAEELRAEQAVLRRRLADLIQYLDRYGESPPLRSVLRRMVIRRDEIDRELHPWAFTTEGEER